MNLSAEGRIRRSIYVAFATGLVSLSLNAVAQDAPVAIAPPAEQATPAPAPAEPVVTPEAAAPAEVVPVQNIAVAQPEKKSVQLERVQVTGSRIRKKDYSTASPTVTVSREALTKNGDVTLDTFLNTLPQVNPSGGTTSNNPGNNGQSNIDLRGLGSNRNLVLIDGRRPMVSASNQTVDLNTIPQALIESVEIVTGGAGAVYGADAIAGAVNVKLKKNFQGVDLRASYGDNSKKDSAERQFSAVLGSNFDSNRGNAVIAFDYSNRELLVKGQRSFAGIASTSTSFLPEGAYRQTSGNGITQAAVDSVFAGYGFGPGVALPTSVFGFNLDGTLFGVGSAGTAIDVTNFRYPIDSNVNTNFFPDFYSYNFDAVNALVLPLERRSTMSKLNYKFDNGIEVFTQFGYSTYRSLTNLAPTPVPTVSAAAAGSASPDDFVSANLAPGVDSSVFPNVLIVPTTNPFIPTDLRTLLNSRTGDNPNILGTGANEAFLMRQRTLSAGARNSVYENTVIQYLGGASGPFGDTGWRWETYVSEGRTNIVSTQRGGIDTQRLQGLLEAADGGASVCTGGFNPFGRQPLSPSCVRYLEVPVAARTDFLQQIAQAFVSGPIADLPAGSAELVLGAETRTFEYELIPGALSGPISGPNTIAAAAGENSFFDVFSELSLPVLKDLPYAKAVDLSFGFRTSRSSVQDNLTGVTGDSPTDEAYKVDLSWKANDFIFGRASYQHSVRAPNFGELFDAGASSPQYFDPCSVTSQARSSNNPDAAQLRDLCVDTGLDPADADSYVQPTGSQTQIGIQGNPRLAPESANTYSAGVVLSSPWSDPFLKGLQGSFDYYRIAVNGAIGFATTDVIIADCYNYYGNNPGYEVTPACESIIRAGSTIDEVRSDTTDGAFLVDNGGRFTVSGLDIQVDYRLPLGTFGYEFLKGTLGINFLANHVLEAKQKDAPDVPTIDYSGTVGTFSANLGQSFPKWKLNLGTQYSLGRFAVDARARYIDGMTNRNSSIFPGETQFTGVGAVTYWDFGASYKILESTTFRLGVQNAFDKQPPTYSPNVQSGTDPQLYDVIGRRFLAQVTMKF